ncbi:MAG: ABC transporter permease [Bacteroidales bacterium]|jgi:ABC-type antimicrobial peptide transport system permease subunit|nr:ABC transporter permease [Bacteroidales bacterium]
MLKSFLKIALRYLWRKKTYSILNFVCLTFGLTCAIISVLYIQNVFSYDKFHKNYNRLYAVDAYVTFFNGDRFPKKFLSASLTDVLKEQAPEIECITRIAQSDYSFTNGDKTFIENGFYADDNFFDVFTFPLSQTGNINGLTDPNSIVISERMAMKFFESTNCVGKTLILRDDNKKEAFVVAGVFQDVCRQSVMQFDYVIPFSKFMADNTWASETGATANETWVLLKNNVDYKEVENKIKDLIKNQETTLNQELFLFPLKEQILYSYSDGKRVWNEMENIVIVGAIGLAILLIACFNYINIAIALNFRRYREIGIRKVAGSGKSKIILQFLGETLIITLLSLFVAIILVQVLLIGFNTMFNYDIHLRLLDFNIIAFSILITLFSSMISGLLPALYLASSDPIDALKGGIIKGHSYSIFRQSLIVFQFTIPIVLIICMMIIKTQDSYMRNYDVGVDQDKLIILDNSKNIQLHAESVKAELLAIPGIDAVSFTNCIPSRGAKVTSEVNWEGKDATEKPIVWCVSSDFDYNKTVNIKIVEGRFFDPSFSTDSTSFLINDVAAGVMKNENPVGSSITLDGQKGTIIGVFKDFHSIDLAGPITPTIITIRSDYKPIILVKYSAGSFQGVTGEIRKIYQHYESEVPFQATLFRDLIPYSNLSRPSKIVGYAFVIALLLACMGFFGLASFTAENRTKEIGIRKANGATTLSVIRLLLTSYTKWLIMAFFIAVPIAYLIGTSFLGRFHFHTPMPLWAFIAGPITAVVVALFTVSAQTWTVANRNPVKTLRYE